MGISGFVCVCKCVCLGLFCLKKGVGGFVGCGCTCVCGRILSRIYTYPYPHTHTCIPVSTNAPSTSTRPAAKGSGCLKMYLWMGVRVFVLRVWAVGRRWSQTHMCKCVYIQYIYYHIKHETHTLASAAARRATAGGRGRGRGTAERRGRQAAWFGFVFGVCWGVCVCGGFGFIWIGLVWGKGAMGAVVGVCMRVCFFILYT